VTRQSHFKKLIVSVLFQIGAYEQFDEPVVGTCGNESFGTGPIDAVDAANVVILLLENNVNRLNESFSIIIKTTTRIYMVFIAIVVGLTV